MSIPTVAEMRSALLRVDANTADWSEHVRPHKTPKYQTTTYRFRNPAEMREAFAGRRLLDAYSLLSNPNYRALEAKLVILEQGEAAQVCAAGRSAIQAALYALSRPGETIIAHEELYGGTYDILRFLCEDGRKVIFVDAQDAKAVAAAIDEKTSIVLIESPTNPSLQIIDIETVARAATIADSAITVIVDNTFATPFNQRPLTLGKNIVVIESLTKYLNGKGTYFGGGIIGAKTLIDRIYPRAILAPMDPGVAWEIGENLLDFLQAMPIHNHNAWEIAHFLANDPHIAQIYYPGLIFHCNHDIAVKQMRALDGGTPFGGMVSFELHGTKEDAERFIGFFEEHGTFITHAVSLGSRDSLIEMPSCGTHAGKGKAIKETFVRLSVGIENHFDLKQEINAALTHAFPAWV